MINKIKLFLAERKLKLLYWLIEKNRDKYIKDGIFIDKRFKNNLMWTRVMILYYQDLEKLKKRNAKSSLFRKKYTSYIERRGEYTN